MASSGADRRKPTNLNGKAASEDGPGRSKSETELISRLYIQRSGRAHATPVRFIHDGSSSVVYLFRFLQKPRLSITSTNKKGSVV